MPSLSKVAHTDAGPTDAPPIVFIHGYPDDISMWGQQVRHFETSHRCIRLELPGFGKPTPGARGAGIDAVVSALETALDELDPPLGGPATFVLHDWGAIYGYRLLDRRPELLERLVAVDVRYMFPPQKCLLGYVLIPLYQSLLALSYLLSRIPLIGTMLGMIVASILLAAFLFLNGDGSAGWTRRTGITPILGYPYYYLFRAILTRRFDPRPSLPDRPILYIYGTRGMKRFMRFHDDAWLEALDRADGSQAIAFTASSHWPMLDETDRFNAALEAFLAG